MAQSSFPWENVSTSETQYSQLFRTLNGGVNGSPAGGELEVTAAFTGLAVDVAAGEAMVQGHFYISTAVETLSLAVADAQPRIDTIILRLDPVDNSIVLAVLTGTPGASPVAPTLTQTLPYGLYEFPLANVAVPAGAGTPGTITDRRDFMGTKLGSWTTAGRPTPSGNALFGFNTTTSRVEVYNTNTSAWQDVTPASLNEIGDVTITSPVAGHVLRWNGSAWVNGAAPGFTARSVITASNSSWPVPALASRFVKVTVIGAGGGGGSAGGSPTTSGGTGGTTTFNAGGAGSVSASGGAGGATSKVNVNGANGTAGFGAGNGGQGAANTTADESGISGSGGNTTVSYLNLSGISTVNVTIGAGGTAGTGSNNGGTGGRGEVIVEYVAG